MTGLTCGSKVAQQQDAEAARQEMLDFYDKQCAGGRGSSPNKERTTASPRPRIQRTGVRLQREDRRAALSSVFRLFDLDERLVQCSLSLPLKLTLFTMVSLRPGCATAAVSVRSYIISTVATVTAATATAALFLPLLSLPLPLPLSLLPLLPLPLPLPLPLQHSDCALCSGHIESSELMRLGAARRSLGQATGEWNEAKNKRMVGKMGGGSSGTVTSSKFVNYFLENLSTLPDTAFKQTIAQFELAAAAAAAAAAACKKGLNEATSTKGPVSQSHPRQVPAQSVRKERVPHTKPTAHTAPKPTAAEKEERVSAVTRMVRLPNIQTETCCAAATHLLQPC